MTKVHAYTAIALMAIIAHGYDWQHTGHSRAYVYAAIPTSIPAFPDSLRILQLS